MFFLRELFILVFACALCAVLSQSTDRRPYTTRPTPTAWTHKTFPNPQLQPRLCGRGSEASWVCDPTGVLTEHEAETIDALLEYQHKLGACQCGSGCQSDSQYGRVQGAVAITNRMLSRRKNPSKTLLRELARKFAETLRDDRWEFGICNDDYVIFISVEDRQVYTATGGNARKIMTDSCVQEVYQLARPLLTEGSFGQAIKLMIKQYSLIITDEHDCNRSTSKWYLILIGVLAGIFTCGGGCFLCYKCGGCKNWSWGGSGGSSYRSTTYYHGGYFGGGSSGGGGGGGGGGSGGGGGDF